MFDVISERQRERDNLIAALSLCTGRESAYSQLQGDIELHLGTSEWPTGVRDILIGAIEAYAPADYNAGLHLYSAIKSICFLTSLMDKEQLV